MTIKNLLSLVLTTVLVLSSSWIELKNMSVDADEFQQPICREFIARHQNSGVGKRLNQIEKNGRECNQNYLQSETIAKCATYINRSSADEAGRYYIFTKKIFYNLNGTNETSGWNKTSEEC